MKRVLNSGTIKLPYVQGSEKTILASVENISQDQALSLICNTFFERLKCVEFKFEVKAPLLVFNSFQKGQLGTLSIQQVPGELESYLPPQFYKQDASSFIPMDSKTCNELNTKMHNFYIASANFYKKLMDNGLCEEQAALILPHGLFSTFLWSVNAMDLIRFIENNYNKSPEMYGYCATFVLYLEEHLPLITKWLKQNRWQNYSL